MSPTLAVCLFFFLCGLGFGRISVIRAKTGRDEYGFWFTDSYGHKQWARDFTGPAPRRDI